MNIRSKASRVCWCLLVLVVAPAGFALAQATSTPSIAQSCLPQINIKRSRVLNDRNILYVTKGGQAYNNVLPKQCPALRRDTTLAYTYVNAKLCAGSTFTVLQRVGIGSQTQPYWNPATNEKIALPAPAFVPTFVCQLGLFTPVSESEVEDIIGATEDKPRRSRRSTREMVETENVSAPTPAPSPPQP